MARLNECPEGVRRFDDVAAGLRFESALFDDDAPAVGVWGARANAIVCPAAYRRRAGFAQVAARSARRGWRIFFRSTGGGAVPQGAGVLNFAVSMTANGHFRMESGYRLIAGAIRAALGSGGRQLTTGAINNSFCNGGWNLSVGKKKVVGMAQHWRGAKGGKNRILMHAAILIGGRIAPGIGAVDAIHHDMGLCRVYAKSHTTMENALAPAVINPAAFADKLRGAALREIAAMDGV